MKKAQIREDQKRRLNEAWDYLEKLFGEDVTSLAYYCYYYDVDPKTLETDPVDLASLNAGITTFQHVFECPELEKDIYGDSPQFMATMIMDYYDTVEGDESTISILELLGTIGLPSLLRFLKRFGGKRLKIPTLSEVLWILREVKVAHLLTIDGWSEDSVKRRLRLHHNTFRRMLRRVKKWAETKRGSFGIFKNKIKISDARTSAFRRRLNTQPGKRDGSSGDGVRESR